MLTESFLRYLRYQRRVSVHTLSAYESDLSQFEGFLGANYPDLATDKAGFGEVRAWMIALADSGLKPVSVNRKMASLRAYYRFLMKEGALSANPMKKIRSLRTEKRLPAFVRESEMTPVADPPEGAPFAVCRDRLIVELLYATGIRLSELIQLKDSRVDLRGLTIKVLGKRNKERIVPFPDTLVPLLKEYRAIRNREIALKEKDRLFVTEKGSACYPMMVYRIVKNFLTTHTSVEKRSPHVLRHTYATHLLNKGAEINAVKDLLGHANLAATQVYTHNTMEKLKKTFDRAHPKA